MAPGNSPRESGSRQPDALRLDVEAHFNNLKTSIDDTKTSAKISETMTRLKEATPEIIQNAVATVHQAQELLRGNNRAAAIQIINTFHAGLLKGKPLPTPNSPEMKELTDRFQDVATKVTTVFESLRVQFTGFGSGVLKMIAGFLGPNTPLGQFFNDLKESDQAKTVYLFKTLKGEPEGDLPTILSTLTEQASYVQDSEEAANGKQKQPYDFVSHVKEIAAKNPPLTQADLISKGDEIKEAKMARFAEKKAKQGTTQIAAAPGTTQKVEGKERPPIGETNQIFEVTQAGEKMALSFKNQSAVFSKEGKDYSASPIDGQKVSKVSIVDATPTAPAEITFVVGDKTVRVISKDILEVVKSASSGNNKNVKGRAPAGDTIEFEITPIATA